MAGLQGWHFIVLLVIVLLLFGAAKLPALAKSLGQSARLFKGELQAMKSEDADGEQSTSTTPESGTTSPANDAATGTDKPSS